MSKTTTFGVAVVLATIVAMPLLAQTPQGPPDPAFMAARLANGMMPEWLTKAADAMSEADYAFKPTPEVRSFGQLLAHVANSDYMFCSIANGEKQPVRDVEKTRTTKAEIQQALAEAFAYCNGVYAGMTEAKARTMVQLGSMSMPALTVLLIRTHHSSLHYGNVITYMRLRGKVPPSSTSPISQE